MGRDGLIKILTAILIVVRQKKIEFTQAANQMVSFAFVDCFNALPTALFTAHCQFETQLKWVCFDTASLDIS